ncbi:aminopeptidase [Fictibacillus sp. BK138]|uniref:aminopeptidase n=1 Tax=Fictibacillus sp. BK138 TaxID=2512121 RepID=UPI0010290976|nr:aminopeptidase [Fictibacillus sp. BK138]RZT15513.1 aminopeptidase [Fictibacillus sp. BK138]
MRDQRLTKLAEILLDHSVKIQPHETLMIDVYGDGSELAKELVKEAYKRDAFPFVNLIDEELQRLLIEGSSEEREALKQKLDLATIHEMKASIRIYGSRNDLELSKIDPQKRLLNQKARKPYMDHLINNVKWSLLNYPNAKMAQKAGMSLEEFEDMFFKVCTLDYSKMDRAMDNLKELLDKTDHVHIKGPGTDLEFSIKGQGSIKCAGEVNIPDGEIYTAPVRESVNGTISFNTSSTYQGTSFSNIVFEFKNGKIIEARSNDEKKLKEILDTDEGARFIGEFAIGVNPYILNPINDTLFDEKIAGSFHFTPGQAYKDESYNGNDSKIHWDIVNIQRPEYGGGEIWFDGVLIRKDGLFVIDSLLPLNPEHLVDEKDTVTV